MRPGIVLAAGLGVLAVAVGVALAESEPRQAGSNYVPQWEGVTELRGRDRHCQEEGLVPADATAVRMLVGTHFRPTPAIRVTMSRLDGDLLSSGTLAAGQPQGEVVVPLDPPIEETGGGIRTCVATGPGRRTVLYGASDRIRLEWLRQGEESWLALLPTVAHRFGLGKGLAIGEWLLVFAALLLVGAWVVALRLVMRELAP